MSWGRRCVLIKEALDDESKEEMGRREEGGEEGSLERRV